MCCKNEYFNLFDTTYLKVLPNRIYLLNTKTKTEFVIKEKTVVKEITSKAKLYNSIFCVDDKADRRIYEEMERLRMGKLLFSDHVFFRPLNCIKIENNKEQINKENPLLLSKQLQANVIEVSVVLYELFDQKPIDRQVLPLELGTDNCNKEFFSTIRDLLNGKDLFKHLQRFNIYINALKDFRAFNAMNILGVEDILHVHVPVGLYVLLEEINVKYKLHVYFNGAKNIDKVKNVSEDHKIVLYIENPDMLKHLSLPNPRIAILPLYSDNIEFLKQSVFVNQSDILGQDVDVFKILRNGVINTFDFGKVFIDSKGDMGTNFYGKPIANYYKQNLTKNLLEYYNENSSWYLTRDKVTPCSECNYCNICPPISGLEYLINQFNLCHLHHE